jgi:RimJ/RimL family protein N-acetyltransferase
MPSSSDRPHHDLDRTLGVFDGFYEPGHLDHLRRGEHLTEGAEWSELPGGMQGRLVSLEPLALEHEDELFAAAGPPEIWDWWPLNPAVDRSTFHDWMLKILARVSAGTEARFATRELATGRLVGSTSFCTLRPEHAGLEIGWTWLTPSAWGGD